MARDWWKRLVVTESFVVGLKLDLKIFDLGAYMRGMFAMMTISLVVLISVPSVGDGQRECEDHTQEQRRLHAWKKRGHRVSNSISLRRPREAF